jgi:diaminopimelate epimerase
MNADFLPSPAPVAKGEGLGNRFLIFEAVCEAQVQQLKPLAPQLCGSEFDGLLILDSTVDPAAADPASADPATAGARKEVPAVGARILNRDGSEGGVCLNGLRVLAAWSGAPHGAICMAGRRVHWRRVPEPERVMSEHEMGIELHLAGSDFALANWKTRALDLNGQSAVAVRFWNPHCVIQVTGLAGLDLPELAAAARARVDLFPEGVNTEAVVFGSPGQCRIRVYERGVGETEACGSGAVAVAISAWADGHDGPISVQMPGGNLRLQRAGDGGILLSGGASVCRLAQSADGAGW